MTGAAFSTAPPPASKGAVPKRPARRSPPPAHWIFFPCASPPQGPLLSVNGRCTRGWVLTGRDEGLDLALASHFSNAGLASRSRAAMDSFVLAMALGNLSHCAASSLAGTKSIGALLPVGPSNMELVLLRKKAVNE